ncbi:MAG TPA: alpha/beta hydrolase [Aromatoleum sp.]|uniref:alpha/beta hydrolase n=1 Tax=Aromatoleum sp. TaxID=2307007 RepID=UPI002B489149|nr:alpha/beta hydrolase [Aromatoleum sp.]HJV27637.1 alpha/beta hydrolase [Aromatoleum sp.]
MPLDPQAQAVAAALADFPQPDYATLTVPEYRAMLAAFPPPPPVDVPLSAVENRTLTGAAGPLPCRLYRPQAIGPLPVTVFFHGGGFVSCGLDTHDTLCRYLAARSGSLVVSVDYRLAPEHRFPAPVDDAVAAVRWVHDHADEIGAEATRIVVAGDSAGGNLAAAAAKVLRDGGPAICHQLLLYPVIDSACDSASFRELAQAPMLTAEMMRWFWRHYLPDAAAGNDPRASLLNGNLAGLPPAIVITAEEDPLRDEGEAYARAMEDAGVRVTLCRWGGQFHGFASLLGTLNAAREALDFTATLLAKALAK